MDLSLETTNGTCRVSCRGEFTFADNQRFKEVLETIGGSATNAVVVNMANVTFIDSAALGMLLLLKDRAAEKKMEVIIDNAQGQVKKILLVSRFDQLFTFRNSLQGDAA